MSRQADRKPKKTYLMYEDGNTVRRLEAVPDYPGLGDERKRRKEDRRISEQKRRRRRAARRNRERALKMSAGYVAFLSACVVGVGFLCSAYVNLQTDLIIRQDRIEALESSISDLKLDNDARYKRITTTVDIKELRRKARKLGMRYPSSDQILYYTVDSADYMTQYTN